MARRIAMGFGVPPQIIGIIGDSTYRNYDTAEQSFWEKTVLWYLNYIRDEYNNWFFDDSETFIDYEIDEIPALSPRRAANWKNANEATFLTTNEKREITGYKPVGPDGDTILIQSFLVPLSQQGMEASLEEAQEEEDTVAREEEEAIKALVENGYGKEEAREYLGLED